MGSGKLYTLNTVASLLLHPHVYIIKDKAGNGKPYPGLQDYYLLLQHHRSDITLEQSCNRINATNKKAAHMNDERLSCVQ